MIKPSGNEGVQRMYRFEYRNPRFSADLSAHLCIATKTLVGRCTDIGIKGMRLDLPDTLVHGCKGMVCLQYQNQAIELKVRVARIGSMHCGLEFICDSQAEPSTVVHLLAKLTAPLGRRQISLVPRVDASLGGPTLQH
jgi:PilZ domain